MYYYGLCKTAVDVLKAYRDWNRKKTTDRNLQKKTFKKSQKSVLIWRAVSVGFENYT